MHAYSQFVTSDASCEDIVFHLKVEKRVMMIKNIVEVWLRFCKILLNLYFFLFKSKPDSIFNANGYWMVGIFYSKSVEVWFLI